MPTATTCRPLRPGEIAHHRDENKRNNAPDNIDVLPSQAEHARLHFTVVKRPPRTHCKSGHQFTDETTYRTWAGSRGCRTCRRDYDNRYKKDQRRARGLRSPGPRPGFVRNRNSNGTFADGAICVSPI